MGARSRGRAATPRRRHGAASGGGQGLGGREPDVLDRDDALALLPFVLSGEPGCCAPALVTALDAAPAALTDRRGRPPTARHLGAGGEGDPCPGVT